MNISLIGAAQSIPSAFTAIVPFQVSQDPEVVFRSTIQRKTELAYANAFELMRAETRLLVSYSLKIKCFTNELTQLSREGLFNGEALIARGLEVLFNLKSSDVTEIAKVKKGDPQFMIGSVSKQFFAVALLKALYSITGEGSESAKVESVKTLILQPLSYFLPKDSSLWADGMPEWANTISLYHLLSHTSGLPDYCNECNEEYEALTDSGTKFCESFHPQAIREMLKIISKHPMNFAPGLKYSYSNTGYRLIAEVIQSITRMPASRYVHETLFVPLGMTSTYNPERGNGVQLRQSDPQCSRLVPELSYDLTDEMHLHPAPGGEDLCWTQGDGSIISTAFDLLRWNVALHQRKSVLPKALYALFTRSNLNGYAYGIINKILYSGPVLSHNGGIGNYITTLAYLPEKEISIIQFRNAREKSPQLERAGDEMMEALKEEIPDVKKRGDTVNKVLRERHPDRRMERIERMIDSLLNS
jgi:CubicO group peptidase (beta-lactamase class C family)